MSNDERSWLQRYDDATAEEERLRVLAGRERAIRGLMLWCLWKDGMTVAAIATAAQLSPSTVRRMIKPTLEAMEAAGQ